MADSADKTEAQHIADEARIAADRSRDPQPQDSQAGVFIRALSKRNR